MPNNHQKDDFDEAAPIINGEVYLKSTGEDIANPGATSGDAFESNLSPHLDQKEQSRTVDIDPGASRDGPSQAVNEDIHLPLERAFSGCMRKKLLVLDVNGLLVDISSYVPYDHDPDAIISKKAVFKRPYCDDFLKFCFERFNVGVWSSRNKRNVESVLDFLLGNDKCKLLFCWDQSHCTYAGFNTVENREKPLLLKKLKRLWEKREPDLPWERGEYNESNTLLLDDSPCKAICNPPYTAIFPYTYWFRDTRDKSLGPGGDLRVYLEGLALAENVQEYVEQNPFGQRPITERNLSWRFYRKVIEANSSPPPNTGDHF
ncbi:Haloacid dehalogenase-like hydrolase (HAD) superfamily protein [Abeliophyllum distichum]|uniref:Mitochondrial import inner membrane translocase subunit TIM50 n=1 Tax=Abeliophyllum distichum TaxID=126358 RepID=A0ABD1PDM5_9LAMI